MSTCVPAHLKKDKLLLHHIDTLDITKKDVKIDKYELSTFYWLPSYTESL